MQTTTGSRIVLIGGMTATTTANLRRQPTCQRQVTPRRIVVIKDGQLVGGKAGR
jgi:hypothetical protein